MTYYSISTDVISKDEWVVSSLAKGLSMQEVTKMVAAGHPTSLRTFQPLPGRPAGARGQ